MFDAARDDAMFASGRSYYGGKGLNNVIPKAPVRLHIPVELDLPEHRSYRKVINPVTSPAAVERMQPMIERWTTAFVDDVIEDGTCDLASVIGVPAVVTIDWLGLDVDDWRRYSRRPALGSGPPGRQPRARPRRRGGHPLDGAHHHRGHRRAPSGNLATTSSRSSSRPRSTGADHRRRRLLDRRAAHLRRRRHHRLAGLPDPGPPVPTPRATGSGWPRNPELLDRAVEEFLRVFSPTQALARTVTHDVEFHGCPMKEGDRVLLAWSSANRDPAQFDHPDEVVLDPLAEPAHRLRHGHPPLRRRPHRPGHRPRAHRQVITRMPDYVVDLEGLQALPTPRRQRRLPADPGDLHPGRRLGS